jgi:hypothetical protein
MSTHTASAAVLPTTVDRAAAVNIWQWPGILGRLLRVNQPQTVNPTAVSRA